VSTEQFKREYLGVFVDETDAYPVSVIIEMFECGQEFRVLATEKGCHRIYGPFSVIWKDGRVHAGIGNKQTAPWMNSKGFMSKLDELAKAYVARAIVDDSKRLAISFDIPRDWVHDEVFRDLIRAAGPLVQFPKSNVAMSNLLDLLSKDL
jgi:hypothetical protein